MIQSTSILHRLHLEVRYNATYCNDSIPNSLSNTFCKSLRLPHRSYITCVNPNFWRLYFYSGTLFPHICPNLSCHLLLLTWSFLCSSILVYAYALLSIIYAYLPTYIPNHHKNCLLALQQRSCGSSNAFRNFLLAVMALSFSLSSGFYLFLAFCKDYCLFLRHWTRVLVSYYNVWSRATLLTLKFIGILYHPSSAFWQICLFLFCS